MAPAEAVIAGAGQVPYTRHPQNGVTTTGLLADALRRAVEDAGLDYSDVDGLAVASYSLAPDHAVDLAWQLGLSPRWLMEDRLGGVNGLNMVQHAIRAVEAGDASVIVVLAGDHIPAEGFAGLADNYSVPIREYLAPLPYGGFNTVFAMLTQRHMAAHGLGRGHYGEVAVTQRAWAAGNPVAAYRDPLTLEQYLDSPMIVDPLCRYDCVPWVTGAEALLITSADRSGPDRVRVRAQVAKFNFDHQDGDGLSTGLGVVAPELWESAGLGPEDMDVLAIYDDYPAMVLIQLQDLGYIADGDVERFVRTVIAPRTIPINTSGGQLSAGQAGGAAGMHGLVEVVQQLRGRAEDRQVDGANIGLAVGYGSVIYRYAGCSGAAILERA